MAKHVIETAAFKLNESVRREEFTSAAEAINAFVRSQPGFIARRLSCGADDEWIDHVEWADMATAKAAAAEIRDVEDNRPFLSAIHGPSVKLTHTELETSVDSGVDEAKRAADRDCRNHP